MAVFGVVVLLEATDKLLWGGAPQAMLMASVGGAALAANSVCLALLTRHCDNDVNMRSAWICSRNDLIANGLNLQKKFKHGFFGMENFSSLKC